MRGYVADMRCCRCTMGHATEEDGNARMRIKVDKLEGPGPCVLPKDMATHLTTNREASPSGQESTVASAPPTCRRSSRRCGSYAAHRCRGLDGAEASMGRSKAQGAGCISCFGLGPELRGVFEFWC